MNMPKQLMSQFATLALGLAATSAWAHQTWTGSGEGDDWNTPGNWSGGTVPGDGEDALFDTGAIGANVSFAGNYTMANQLKIQTGSTNDVDAVTFTADSAEHGLAMSNTSWGRINIGLDRAGALVLGKGTWLGAGYDTDSGAQFYIGNGHEGVLAILEDATLKASRLSVGNTDSGNYGYGYLLLNGGSVLVNKGTYVGEANCTGKVEIVAGTYTSPDFNIGQGGLSYGKTEVKRTGKIVATTAVSVGNNANAYGELHVSQGGVVESSTLRVAGNGNAETPTTGRVVIDGGEITIANAYLGDNRANNTGVVEVVSGKLTASGSINIGQTSGGYGELIYRGGTLSGSLNIGNKDGSAGKFTVKDSAYVFDSDFSYPKAYATGILEVGDGGTLTVPNLYIAGKDKYGSAGSHYTGYATVYTNGTLAATGFLSLGKGAHSESKLTVDGGTVTAAAGLYLARDNSYDGDNAKAEVEVKNCGSLIVSANGVTIARNSGGQGTIKVGNEGSVDVTGDITMTYSGNSTGIVEVVGGTFNVSGKITCGSSWAGALSTYTQSGGEAKIGDVVQLGGTDNNSTGNHSEGLIKLSGGTLEAKGVTVSGKSDNVYSLVFDGGTLKANAGANTTFVPSDSRLAVSITANGGAIDTNGKNLTVASSITGTGTLTKKGLGTLTLGEPPTFPIRIEGGNVVFPENAVLTSKITVAAGAVYVYDPSLTYTGGIEVENGGLVVLDNKSYTSGTQYDIPAAITFLAGAVAEDSIVVNTGARTTVAFSGSTYTITDANSETPVTTVWLGGTYGQIIEQGGVNVGEFYYNANWSHGAPTAIDTAIIAGDCTIRTWEGTKHNGRHPLYELVLKDGATLTFLSGWPSNRQPALQPQRISGNGTLRLGSTGIVYNETVDCVVESTVTVEFIAGQADENVARASWVEGGSKGVIFYGPVKNPSGALVASGNYVQFIGAVDISSADAIVYTEDDTEKTVRTSFYNCTMNGTVTINGRAEFYKTGINGNISGAGRIDIPVPSGSPNSSTVTLSGDNSAFEGTVYATRNINFASAAAGSAKAYWWLPNCDVTIAVESGALKFGHLYCAGNKKLFKMADGVTPNDLIIEVGKGEIIGKKYFDSGAGLDVTLKKVAFSEDEAGAFTYAGYGFPKIEVAAGEFMFRDDSSDSDAYVQPAPFAVAATVTVDAGAVVSGTNAVSISSLTLADGAFIAGPGTKLTNVGTATLEGADGVKVLVADATALTAGTRYNLITATEGVNGRPYGVAVDASGADVAASNGNEKEFWLARVRGKILHLVEANPRAGLQIILR